MEIRGGLGGRLGEFRRVPSVVVDVEKHLLLEFQAVLLRGDQKRRLDGLRSFTDPLHLVRFLIERQLHDFAAIVGHS